MSTPWHGDYHHNCNAWQPYWTPLIINHPDLAEPWIRYMKKILPRMQWLAQTTYDGEGACIGIASFAFEPDPAKCQSVNRRQIAIPPFGPSYSPEQGAHRYGLHPSYEITLRGTPAAASLWISPGRRAGSPLTESPLSNRASQPSVSTGKRRPSNQRGSERWPDFRRAIAVGGPIAMDCARWYRQEQSKER